MLYDSALKDAGDYFWELLHFTLQISLRKREKHNAKCGESANAGRVVGNNGEPFGNYDASSTWAVRAASLPQQFSLGIFRGMIAGGGF